MGLVELAQNSNCGAIIDYDTIPLIPGTEEFCRHYGLDPFGLIASGALLMAVPKEEVGDIVSYLEKNNVHAVEIGSLTNNPGKYSVKNDTGEIKPLKYSPIDEITRIF